MILRFLKYFTVDDSTNWKTVQLILVCEMTLNGIDLHLFHESK